MKKIVLNLDAEMLKVLIEILSNAEDNTRFFSPKFADKIKVIVDSIREQK